MKPVKAYISIKISGREILLRGGLQRATTALYSRAFVKRVKSSVLVNVLSVCICIAH
jgi:hypothetical protein